MFWEGNRQIQEYTDHHIFTTVYDQDSFEPVSRVIQSRDKTCDDLKIYHYHNNHLGTPQELTDNDGNVIWANYEYAWGGRYNHFYKEQSLNNCDIIETDLQPIRFQGQSLDIETGLHYNRFRYYDSDVGMFIQRDPIGLLGGFNIFQYADNPVMWIDPLGLNKLKNQKVEHFDDFDSARRSAFEKAGMTDPDKIRFSKYDPKTGTVVEFKDDNGAKVAYDSAHADMDPEKGHDKPHVGWQTGGKRRAGGTQRGNNTYSGELHPHRPDQKLDSDLC